MSSVAQSLAGVKQSLGRLLADAYSFLVGCSGAGGVLAGLRFLLAGSGLFVFFVVIFCDVLDDNRDAAVGRIEWGVGLAQALVRKSADLGYLIRREFHWLA